MTFISPHDKDGRPFLIQVSLISTVVHRGAETEGPALVCLTDGRKEAVSETVAQVKRLLANVGCKVGVTAPIA